MVSRGSVYWVELDPVVGSEIRKTRPCLVVSPDDMNHILPRALIAPLTTKGQPLGCRPVVSFQGRKCRILLDQLRSVDKSRLKGRLGEIPLKHWHPVVIEMLS